MTKKSGIRKAKIEKQKEFPKEGEGKYWDNCA